MIFLRSPYISKLRSQLIIDFGKLEIKKSTTQLRVLCV